MTPTPLTASADPSLEMPGDPGARLDRAAAAIASLREERRRLERLGLELPLARADAQLRYWKFVGALCTIAAPGAGR